MGMMLHVNAGLVERDAVRALPTPPPTATHFPLPHISLVDMVKFSLNYFGHDVVDEHHALTEDGDSYFGLLTLRTRDGQYGDVVGLRNNHTKKFPAGISFGSRTFVCDNLAFSGDTVVNRRHTKKLRQELPSIVAGIVEPLRQKRERQHDQFELYQATELNDNDVDHLIMSLYRQGAINVTRIADVLGAYENPPFEWGEKRSAWRLFQATTCALEGRIAENPAATAKLHAVIDGHCMHLN